MTGVVKFSTMSDLHVWSIKLFLWLCTCKKKCMLWRNMGKGGGTFAKIVRGCACQTSKIRLSLHQFFAHLPTHQYTFFDRKVCSHLVFLQKFAQNTLNFWIWAPSFLMKTHRSLYQISRKSTPKGRHIPNQCENHLGTISYKVHNSFNSVHDYGGRMAIIDYKKSIICITL